MSSEIMQENTPFVECSAFHRGMSVLEASLRNTEDSEAIISGLLKGAAEFYGASRASVVEADWDLGIGVITYEWCKDGVSAQRDMLQCLPMEKFPRWRKALRANKPVVISDLQRLEKVYPDEAAFFREYGVTTLLAAPFSKRINQGFIAVDDPTRYTDDPVFLFIASYAVVVELNEIKQQQSLLAATKASKYNPEDIHVNFFGGMEIISSKGTLTGEDIKADQCYASKYALSERLVCGECGTLYRRCTWTRNGEKRVVWRCVSRLDYGKKYCHNSPTLDEAPLQQAILAVLNTAMADKNSLIRQITAAMETELIPFPGGTMSLGDIECRLRVLEQQFQTLLEKATDDPAAYGGQFKEILDEQTFLKEKRSVILANNNEQTKANQRIMDAAQTLENASPYITEWDESAVRQLVETVKILSKDEVAVTLKGGIEICQKIMC